MTSGDFNFTGRAAGELRAATSGQAFPTMLFDHWEAMPDDPIKPGTRTNELVKGIRKRKGLKEDVPLLNEYEDKL